MATSAQTLMRIIEVMTDSRPKTVDKAIELLGGEGLLPAKLLADRVKTTPKKVSRFASMEAEIFAMEQRISIPEGFVGSGKAGEGGKITIVDLRAILAGKTGKTAGEPKEPKAAKAPKEPKEPKEPKAAKAPQETKLTKKVRDRLHEWGLDESALEGCIPTAYKGTKFSVDDIAHLEPGLATGGKGKKTATGKGKASSSASAQSAPSESESSDSDSDTEEQDDDDFDPFDAMKPKS